MSVGSPLKHLIQMLSEILFTNTYAIFHPPQVIQVDGGPEYSGTFEDFCHQQQILVKTSIPRSPQTNGTAESAVKSVKNILTRACAAAPQGINNWTAQLPLVLSSLNAQHPYSANVSRAQLQLSPYFYNLLPLLFTPEPFQFNEDFLQKQHNNYTILNNLRKSNLAKIASQIFKPANFKLNRG